MVKRFRIVCLVVVAACGSGPDPSTTGGEIASILVVPVSSGSYVGSAVLGNGGQIYLTANDSLQVYGFAPSQGTTSNFVPPLTHPEIEMAFGSGIVWWAANQGSSGALWQSPSASFDSPSIAPAAAFPAAFNADIIGLVADDVSAYVAVSTPRPTSAGLAPGPSPDSWQWPATPAVDTPYDGEIYRLVGGSPLPTLETLTVPGGITFFPGFMLHVLAQNASEVYWVDSGPVGTDIGRVMAATKTAWSTDPGRRIGGIQAVPGESTGFVGLAANEAYVTWAVAPEPYFGATGCSVWASLQDRTPKKIYDGDLEPTPFVCNGLAVDVEYAYFATAKVYVPPAGAASSVLLGTGVARVPLAGGPLQTVSLQSDRWYGPRRVLVDDTYVYAIDPSYVLRFPKSAFGP